MISPNENMLFDDYLLLKAFPMLIETKKDIVFTEQIVDLYVDNYKDMVDKNGDSYLEFIPYDAYTREQLMKLMMQMLKSDSELVGCNILYDFCTHDFAAALLHYQSTMYYRFNKNLTSNEWNKVVFATIKHLRSNKFIDNFATFAIPVELAVLVCNRLLNDEKNITKQVSKNLLYMIIYSTSIRFNDDYRDLFVDMLDVILKLHPDMYHEVSQHSHLTLILQLFKRIIENDGMPFLINRIIREWNMDYKTICNGIASRIKLHDGHRALDNIIREYGYIEGQDTSGKKFKLQKDQPIRNWVTNWF